MKFFLGLLPRLASAVEAAQLSPDEAFIEVPGAVLPVATLPLPFKDLAGFSNTETQRESFINQITVGRAASQAATSNNIAVLGRGLWWVELSLIVAASYTQVLDGSVPGVVQLEMMDPVGTSKDILSGFAVVATQVVSRRAFYALFQRDDWLFRQNTEATGVAQTHVGVSSIVALKLL